MYDTKGIFILTRHFIQQNSLSSNRPYNTENYWTTEIPHSLTLPSLNMSFEWLTELWQSSGCGPAQRHILWPCDAFSKGTMKWPLSEDGKCDRSLISHLVCWWVHRPIWQASEQAAPLPCSLFKCRLPCENPLVHLKKKNKQANKQTENTPTSWTKVGFLFFKTTEKKKKKTTDKPCPTNDCT